MRIKFNQSVHLHGKDYPRGTHEVPDKVAGDTYFMKLAEAGLVEDGEQQPTQHQSLQHRQKALFDKIAEQQGKNASARHRKLSDAGNRDINQPQPQSPAAEVNPLTGRAQVNAPNGPGGMVGRNPATMATPAETRDMADANTADTSTGGPLGMSAVGFGEKDDPNAVPPSGPSVDPAVAGLKEDGNIDVDETADDTGMEDEGSAEDEGGSDEESSEEGEAAEGSSHHRHKRAKHKKRHAS